jgi:ABC-type nickel/cobalt efflux system permease component RcnA
VGHFVDESQHKQLLTCAAAVVVALAAAGVALVPGYGVQIVLQLTIGLAATVFPAATGAFALGMSEKDELTGRVARNETFTHTGNAFFALAAGVVGTLSPWPAYFTRRRYSRPEWPHR